MQQHSTSNSCAVRLAAAGKDLAPTNTRLLTQQGGCIAFDGQATIFRCCCWLPGDCLLVGARLLLAKFSIRHAGEFALALLGSQAVCWFASSDLACMLLTNKCCSLCRHVDTGILKYVDVDALVASVLPGAAPAGAAPTQVTRTLL